MFQSARITLTAWYLLILMIISILFSLVIYTSINQELSRFEFRLRDRFEQEAVFGLPMRGPSPAAILATIDDSRDRVIMTLFLVNLGILISAGVAGYFLAGRTLSPIQEMVDEQQQFISDASHELRTPLTALRSEIEVGLRDRSLTLFQAKKLLSSNLEETIALQTLSDNLLQLTKLRSQASSFSIFSLNESIIQAIKLVTPQAKKKEIQILSKFHQEKILGDQISTTQLFVILLDNAIKYSQKKEKVQVIVQRSTKTIQVVIQDSGIGIPENDLPHVFDRFYRSDIARGKATGGYGLGLAIAKRILKDHNGSISIKSKEGKGTMVIVSFPVV